MRIIEDPQMNMANEAQVRQQIMNNRQVLFFAHLYNEFVLTSVS
jgi:hypothetical protein